MEFKTPKPNRELAASAADWSRALDAAREDLAAAKKELEISVPKSLYLLDLYGALHIAEECRERHVSICDPCWNEVADKWKTLQSMWPGD